MERPTGPRRPVPVPAPRSAADDTALAVTVEHRADESVARVVGELDVATAPGFLAAFDELSAACAARGPAGWTLWCDLSGLGFVSASGVTVLEAAHDTAQRRGVALRLASCSRPVRRVLSLVGSPLALHLGEVCGG